MAESIKRHCKVQSRVVLLFYTLDVCFRTQIHVFSFPNRCKKLYTITTRENPRGLCEVTPMRMTSHVGDESAGGEFMVFPGYKTGSMQIVNMATTEQRVSSAPVTINAHQSELCCLAINQQVRQLEVKQQRSSILLFSIPIRY